MPPPRTAPVAADADGDNDGTAATIQPVGVGGNINAKA